MYNRFLVISQNLFFRLICCVLIASCSSCLLFRPSVASNLQKAEAAVIDSNFQAAITFYQAHISERLEVKQRPEWENPYHYMLIIGDLHLRLEQDLEALKSFDAAKAKNVDPKLVADRYRALGAWYESRGNLEKAIEVLKAHRQEDPLLFDAMLDRIAKQIIAKSPAL